MAEIPDELLVAAARDAEHLDVIHKLGLRSYICVPLTARGRVLGALSLVNAESGRLFAPDDVALAEDLARRAALALDNARLFSEAEAARAQAQHTADRLRLALDASKLGPWEWDIVAGRVWWSPAIEAMHGIPEGSFDGTFEAYARDMHPDDRDRVFASVEALLRGGTNHYVHYRIVRPDGQVRWLEAHGRLHRDAEGRPLKLVGVCGDVTERVEHEEALRRAHEVMRASEHRYAQILDSVRDMVFCKDRDLRIVYANRAACEFYGMTAEQLRGLTDVPFNERDFTAKYHRDDLEVLTTGRAVEDLAEPNTRADGEVRSFHVVKTPVRDMDGEVVELVGVARDVTEKLRADEEAKRLERENRAARNNRIRAEIAEALTTRGDLRTVMTRCVEALASRLKLVAAALWVAEPDGYAMIARAGAPLDGAFARLPLDTGPFGALVGAGRALVSEGPGDARLEGRPLPPGAGWLGALPLAHGDERVGVLGLVAERPLSDDLVGVLSIVAEAITQSIDRLRAKAALAAHAEELARSNAELQQFAYVASHDLQEPLRMVASYTQLLARRYRGRLDTDADEFIGFAVDGVTRMQALINDLLAYSRVGTRSREMGDVETSRVVSDTLANLRTELDRHAARVHLGRLPRVRGDAGQLGQLFQNLVANALKFRGDAAPEIRVDAERRDGDWVFTVRDNGIGIAPEFHDRVFIIFQRLHTRDEYPGNGIGLAICKKIVERHGGRIWIESRPGEGAAFSFTLPGTPT
jgi:PAS domain S-box-containing protein